MDERYLLCLFQVNKYTFLSLLKGGGKEYSTESRCSGFEALSFTLPTTVDFLHQPCPVCCQPLPKHLQCTITYPKGSSTFMRGCCKVTPAVLNPTNCPLPGVCHFNSTSPTQPLQQLVLSCCRSLTAAQREGCLAWPVSHPPGGSDSAEPAGTWWLPTASLRKTLRGPTEQLRKINPTLSLLSKHPNFSFHYHHQNMTQTGRIQSMPKKHTCVPRQCKRHRGV